MQEQSLQEMINEEVFLCNLYRCDKVSKAIMYCSKLFFEE